MTGKYLPGFYPSGYNLSSAYDGLNVLSSATIGGYGVGISFYPANGVRKSGLIEAGEHSVITRLAIVNGDGKNLNARRRGANIARGFAAVGRAER